MRRGGAPAQRQGSHAARMVGSRPALFAGADASPNVNLSMPCLHSYWQNELYNFDNKMK